MELVILIGIGFLVAMYIISKVRDNMSDNINSKNFWKNLEEYEKNKSKK